MRKKFGFRISVFSGIALAVIVLMLLGAGGRREQFLFDSDSNMVLYVRTEAGEEPAFRAEEFFPDEELDYGKFSYDMANCDWNVPGTYQIPVLYGGKTTNCRIELTVLKKESPDLPDLQDIGEDKTIIK